jgi:ketopantoate reductase
MTQTNRGLSELELLAEFAFAMPARVRGRMTEQSKETTWGEVADQFHHAIDAVVDADRWVERVKHDVTTTIAKERELTAESARKEPMGVSQWREHGMKHGYWDHYAEGIREFAKAQERQRIMELVNDRGFEDMSPEEDIDHYQLRRNRWNAFARELRALLSPQNGMIVNEQVTVEASSMTYIDGYNTALDDVIRLIEQDRA